MDLTIFDSYEALSRAAADIVTVLVAEQPEANLLVPTGNSPVGMYRALALRCARGDLDLTRLHVFQLDEYVGVSSDDPRSLYRWMREAFLDPCHIPDVQVTRLRGDLPDLDAECQTYDHHLKDMGGLSLAILGLGPNGHLGFNEPPIHADAPTRVVELTAESIQSSAGYWGDASLVPRRAVTAGMRQLLAADHVVLLVSGESKRHILRRTVEGEISPDVPASYLQDHPWTRILADREACPKRA